VGAASVRFGDNSMNRRMPPIQCVFAGMVAILVSSCARFCPGPEPAYAAPPPIGPGYGSGHGIQQYALPPPQYGSSSGMPPYEQSPGQYEPPHQFEPPPGAYQQH
jgi:hypothetical protein